MKERRDYMFTLVRQWLKYTLENIMSINHKNLKDLYPQNYKNNIQKSNL